jgi:hypothetical protein
MRSHWITEGYAPRGQGDDSIQNGVALPQRGYSSRLPSWKYETQGRARTYLPHNAVPALTHQFLSHKRRCRRGPAAGRVDLARRPADTRWLYETQQTEVGRQVIDATGRQSDGTARGTHKRATLPRAGNSSQACIAEGVAAGKHLRSVVKGVIARIAGGALQRVLHLLGRGKTPQSRQDDGSLAVAPRYKAEDPGRSTSVSDRRLRS